MSQFKHKIAGKYNPIRLLFKFSNIVAWTSIWNTVYYKNKEWINTPWLVRHETCHLRQIEREGRIRYAIKYSYYFIRYGYRNNPYEIEARDCE